MKRTPGAVLRAIIGIKDFEMAQLLNCSRATIHSLESGRLRMSEAMAMRMFHETEISPDWLLAGSSKAPPVSVSGKPYTRAIFDRAQAAKAGRNSRADVLLWLDLLDFSARLAAILVSAERGQDYYMARYKTWRALQALRDEFGQDLSVYGSTIHSVEESGEFLDKDAEQAWLVLEKMVQAYAEMEAAFAPLLRARPVKTKNRKR